jgi:hypothetical protein
MPHASTEGQLVEQPAIGLFAEQSAKPEAITAAVPGILCERQPACRRKYRMSNEFLFE